MTEPAPGVFPLPLSAYPQAAGSLLDTLRARVDLEPVNAAATLIFFVAIAHTFAAARFTALAHQVQRRHAEQLSAAGLPARPSVRAELLHFLGEVEVVFGLWAVVLVGALAAFKGWHTATQYLDDTVNYTEPLFVVVVMVIASSRPIVGFAEAALRRVASLGGGTPAAWWLAILTIGPVLGSFITEPAAMTICALLLGRQFFDLSPGTRLKYATLGLLFVNVSIGGTLTHFAAPPVLMVARPWGWDSAYLLQAIGWRAALAVLASTLAYFLLFRREFAVLNTRTPVIDVDQPEHAAAAEAAGPMLPVPWWVVAIHASFLAWTVFTSHYRALFMGGFLFFLGFANATVSYQSRIELKTPLLVGFFLAGLVIHGGLQGWWIEPVLSGLTAGPLFGASAALTAFNDNALITYLATLVPSFDEPLKVAVVQGAVAGGGLTVIANAPNPAGQALLGRFFDGAIAPLGLLLGAALPTLIAIAAFRLL